MLRLTVLLAMLASAGALVSCGDASATVSATMSASAAGVAPDAIAAEDDPGAQDGGAPAGAKGAGKGKGKGKGGKGVRKAATVTEDATADVIPPELHAGDGSKRMAARLAVLAADADIILDRTLNEQRVRHFEEALAEAVRTGAPTSQARLALATEKVNAGRSEEAAQELAGLLADLEGRGVALNPEYKLQLLHTLGIAWMRVGEQSNCVLHHTADSCLLPISEKGRHVDASGSRHAMEVYRQILRVDPKDDTARWLLNIAAQTVGEWPAGVEPEFLVPPSAFASAEDVGRFHDVATACGVADRGLAGGICMEDFDGDGLLDLVTSSWDIEVPLRYHRNDGNGHFTERSAEAGFTGITGGLNMVHADVDNDGDADILVLRGAWKAEAGARHPPSLLQNDGHGTFRDVTEESGLLYFLSTQGAAFADYDGDGWLDLFITNESDKKHQAPCRLFHNDGDGTFTEVGAAAGVDVVSYVKTCGWGDFDEDGDPDLALSRMDGPPILFRNDAGRFTNVTAAAGITDPQQSFPCWWFDHDNDGDLDFFVSGYHFGQADEVCRDYLGLPNDGVTPRLYRNAGGGTFEDATAAAGLMHVYPTMGCNYGDLDNDGWMDFYLSTGEPDLRGIYPNRLLRNREGRGFTDVTTSAGMGHIQKGHGIAFGDLDNDGDQDVFAVMGGAFSGDGFQRSLFENPGHGNAWVTLELQGVASNRCAIGARVRVRVTRPDGSTRDIHHVVGTGASFGSESLQAELGLGDATGIAEVEVRWPGSGARDVLKDLPMQRAWRIVEGAEAPEALTRRTFRLGGAVAGG
jgi:hypothetical protein